MGQEGDLTGDDQLRFAAQHGQRFVFARLQALLTRFDAGEFAPGTRVARAGFLGLAGARLGEFGCLVGEAVFEKGFTFRQVLAYGLTVLFGPAFRRL